MSIQWQLKQPPAPGILLLLLCYQVSLPHSTTLMFCINKKEYLPPSHHHLPIPSCPFPHGILIICLLSVATSDFAFCEWLSAAGSHQIISDPQPQTDPHLSSCGNSCMSGISKLISEYRLPQLNQKWLFWHSQGGGTGMGCINKYCCFQYFLCSLRFSGLKTNDLIK